MIQLITPLFLVLVTCRASDTVVTLPDGTVLQGSQEGHIATFKGIRYAQPPVGDLRWAPPVPWVNENTSQIYDATRFGHACIQYLWGDDGIFDDGSEDCLFLNVYVNLNYTYAEGSVPVGVFVHGGSYISGGSHLPLYDGVDMIEYMQGKAILVTTNYRLNVFGFLGSENLRFIDTESGSTGNYGLQDQRLAFEWVQRNIGSFGGDRNRVTIFGESAGAGSMSNHLTAPKSFGLYQSVILESGSFSDWVSVNLECAEDTYNNILSETNCADVNCLRSLDAITLKRASMKTYGKFCGYAPVVDGVELTTHPWIALANGDINDVPILHGTNSDEGSIFTFFPHDATESQLYAHWANQGYTADQIAQLNELYVVNKSYPDTPKGTVYWWAAQRSLGDNFMSCPAKYTSQQLSNASISDRISPTYLYHFEHTPRHAPVTRHVAEIEFAFHQSELLAHEKDLLMADVMSSYWGNFFTSRNPSSNEVGVTEVPSWSPYEGNSDELLVIKEANDAHMVSGVKRKECDFMIPILDAGIRAKFAA